MTDQKITFFARVRTARFWVLPLGLLSATLVVLLIVSLTSIQTLTTPPGEGKFRHALEGEPGSGSNVTNTLFEDTVDRLSGDRVPVLLFQNVSNFCRDSLEGEYRSSACVARFEPTHIAFAEDYANHLQSAWETATATGLTQEAELLNQWEKRTAAHEFAHILQYNYKQETDPYANMFSTQEIPAMEEMAECFADVLYPMPAETIRFYDFPAEESFPKCGADDREIIRSWLVVIGWERILASA